MGVFLQPQRPRLLVGLAKRGPSEWNALLGIIYLSS